MHTPFQIHQYLSASESKVKCDSYDVPRIGKVSRNSIFFSKNGGPYLFRSSNKCLLTVANAYIINVGDISLPVVKQLPRVLLMPDEEQEYLNLLYRRAANEVDNQRFVELLREICELLDKKHNRQAKAKGA